MVWLWLVGAALAGCDLASLRAAMTEAEDAFAELETDTFTAAATEASYAASCMEQGITPLDAASYHRLKALKAFLDGRPADSTLAFSAVLATQPGYLLPEALAPSGHPLRVAFEAAQQLADGGSFQLPTPGEGWVHVDGRRISTAPAGRPWMFQKFDAAGLVESSAWVPTGGRWPEYAGPVIAPVATAPVPAPVAPPSPVTPSIQPVAARPRATPVQKGLRATGIGLGVASLTAYGAAFAARNQYEGAVYEGDNPRIKSLHGLTNGLTVGAVSGATVSLTLILAGTL